MFNSFAPLNRATTSTAPNSASFRQLQRRPRRASDSSLLTFNRNAHNLHNTLHKPRFGIGSALHPAITHRHRTLKYLGDQTRRKFEELLRRIEELQPSEEDMDWDLCPGVVVYVRHPGMEREAGMGIKTQDDRQPGQSSAMAQQHPPQLQSPACFDQFSVLPTQPHVTIGPSYTLPFHCAPPASVPATVSKPATTAEGHQSVMLSTACGPHGAHQQWLLHQQQLQQREQMSMGRIVTPPDSDKGGNVEVEEEVLDMKPILQM